MTAPALVQVAELAAGYERSRPAITGVSFSARAGQAVAVLGPNGGGKSTLLGALLGLVPWREGTMRLEGRPAWVPQGDRSQLDFPVSALDVALMGAYVRVPWHRRLGRAERGAARDALDRVGLADLSRAPYGSLSAGQRQRVLIARTLVTDARVLLLDEPLTGLDRAAGQRVLELVDELRAEGRVLLVATHDLAQATRLDSVLCLNGRQVAFGPPEATLTAAVVEATYGHEVVVLGDDGRSVVIPHQGP